MFQLLPELVSMATGTKLMGVTSGNRKVCWDPHCLHSPPYGLCASFAFSQTGLLSRDTTFTQLLLGLALILSPWEHFSNPQRSSGPCQQVTHRDQKKGRCRDKNKTEELWEKKHYLPIEKYIYWKRADCAALKRLVVFKGKTLTIRREKTEIFLS